MGDGLSGPSTMKYHYFHGRFTYSVKRSGRGAEGCRALAGFDGSAAS